jgi:hypothetical protein
LRIVVTGLTATIASAGGRIIFVKR